MAETSGELWGFMREEALRLIAEGSPEQRIPRVVCNHGEQRRPCLGGFTVDKFFIVGCPRSGTTMVQQALNRHSQIVIPPETKFFFSFYGHSLAQQARHVRRLNADL